MDKQLVEEMEKDLKTAGLFAMDWLCAETKQIVKEHGLFNSVNHTKSMYEIMAEELIKKNYCKIPEGAVVLTKEEWEGYCATQEALGEIMDREREIGRKEMAEKIFKELKVKLKGYIGLNYLDEICKEITEGKVNE